MKQARIYGADTDELYRNRRELRPRFLVATATFAEAQRLAHDWWNRHRTEERSMVFGKESNTTLVVFPLSDDEVAKWSDMYLDWTYPDVPGECAMVAEVLAYEQQQRQRWLEEHGHSEEIVIAKNQLPLSFRKKRQRK